MVHILVDSVFTQIVIAVHVVLLTVPVRPVLSLLAIAERPRELDKRYTARSGQGKPRTARLVVEDYQLALRVILELVYRHLLFRRVILSCYRHGIGEVLLQLLDHFFQVGEDYQFLSSVCHIVDELGEHLYLSSCGNGLQDSHAHHDLATHCLFNLLIAGVLVLAQILDKVSFRLVVLFPVVNVHLNVLPCLVGKLRKHFRLFPSEETGIGQPPVQFLYIGALLRSVTILFHEVPVASEVFQPAHYLQLLDKVGIVVHYRRSGKFKYVLFPFADSLDKLALLCLA